MSSQAFPNSGRRSRSPGAEVYIKSDAEGAEVALCLSTLEACGGRQERIFRWPLLNRGEPFSAVSSRYLNRGRFPGRRDGEQPANRSLWLVQRRPKRTESEVIANGILR